MKFSVYVFTSVLEALSVAKHRLSLDSSIAKPQGNTKNKHLVAILANIHAKLERLY